jgi:hypothetical protein
MNIRIGHWLGGGGDDSQAVVWLDSDLNQNDEIKIILEPKQMIRNSKRRC